MPIETASTTIERAMFGLGQWELIIILLIILVVFGAGKLPTVGSALGKGIRNFRSSVKSRDEEDEKPETKVIEAPRETAAPIIEAKKTEKVE